MNQLKRLAMALLMAVSGAVIAQHEDTNTTYLETDTGLRIPGKVLEPETQRQTDPISSRGYYIAAPYQILLYGDKVYVDKTHLLEHQFAYVVTPRHHHRSVIELDVLEFLTLVSDHGLPFGGPPTQYFHVLDPVDPVDTRSVDPLDCGKPVHPTVPHNFAHPTGEEGCHGAIGQEGDCDGGNLDVGFSVDCFKTINRSTCVARIECKTGMGTSNTGSMVESMTCYNSSTGIELQAGVSAGGQAVLKCGSFEFSIDCANLSKR